jgi:hypothetical protein
MESEGEIDQRPPRKRTKVVMDQFVNEIRKLIDYLPNDLPEPVPSGYNFGDLTEEELDDYGPEEGTCVSRRMETELGYLNPESRHHLQFKERGAGAVAAIDFLEKYYRKHPSHPLIQNWITGLLEHLKKVSTVELDDSDTNDTGIKVCSCRLAPLTIYSPS